MARTKLAIVVMLGVLSSGGSAPVAAKTHPRIWLTPPILSALRAKAASGDSDWLRVKTHADELLGRRMPRFRVTGASNSNPVRFTLSEPVPWSGSTAVFIGGATGAWSRVNAQGDRPVAVMATSAGPNEFSIPIDSRTFGSFNGQRLVLFFSDGGHSAYGYMGLEWQSIFETLGIAYQVTGNAAYAAKGIELVNYIASLGAAGMLAPIAGDSGFPTRSAIYGLALAYDWFHGRMTPRERAAVIQAINLWFDWYKRAAFERDGPAYGNYFGGHLLGFGLAGFASEGDNPRGREIVAHVRRLFDKQVVPAFATGGFAGGYPVEGFPYGSNHFQRLLYYMLAIESATGAEIIASSGHPQKIARNLLYNLKPNNWQVTDEASCAGDYTGVLPAALPIVLSSMLAGTDEGRWMQYLSQHLAVTRFRGQEADRFVRLLFHDRGRPAVDYRQTEPTWFHSPGDHHFYRRSSWRPDAVWTSIAGGAEHWAGHQMRGAGHIAIQRGSDYLLVNSGQWKGTTGEHGAPEAFDLRSWRGNTLFVDDYGDYLFTGANYLGGQGFWGNSRLLARDGGAEFGYLKTDLTSAYSVGRHKRADARSVRSFQRSFLSLGEGVVLLFDRMRFLKPGYVKKLYFHLNPSGGAPGLAGDTASIRVGSSALFIRTLMPVKPVLAVAADPVSSEDPRPITYRLEVSDSAADAEMTALHVLTATPASTKTMPPAVRVQSSGGAMVGAMVADGRSQRIGLFSSDGLPRATVDYEVRQTSAQDAMHVLVDMIPRVQCAIIRDGKRHTEASTSSDGVLLFRSSQGGRFAIRCQDGRRQATR